MIENAIEIKNYQDLWAVGFFVRAKGAIAPFISKFRSTRSDSIAKFPCDKRCKFRSNIFTAPFVASKILKINEL